MSILEFMSEEIRDLDKEEFLFSFSEIVCFLDEIAIEDNYPDKEMLDWIVENHRLTRTQAKKIVSYYVYGERLNVKESSHCS